MKHSLAWMCSSCQPVAFYSDCTCEQISSVYSCLFFSAKFNQNLYVVRWNLGFVADFLLQVLVEQGTRAGYKLIMEARDFLLQVNVLTFFIRISVHIYVLYKHSCIGICHLTIYSIIQMMYINWKCGLCFYCRKRVCG